MSPEERNNMVSGLAAVGGVLRRFLQGETSSEGYAEALNTAMRVSEAENSWFTQDNIRLALENWAELLTEEKLTSWLSAYSPAAVPKTVGLILAGNLPLVGFQDVVCTLLSGHRAHIKLSSKDRHLIPLLLKIWREHSKNLPEYEFVEKLNGIDLLIGTGSDNTASYLAYYFSKIPNITRKNRTSVGVITNETTDEEIQHLSHDIFQYFGLGCRNVSRLFLPEGFPLDRIFTNLTQYQHIINHNAYANNYDYNKAIFLLNRDLFWDNNFVMMREENSLFGPLSVINFSYYSTLQEVEQFITEHTHEIQCVVGPADLPNAIPYGTAQKPSLTDYADGVDVMQFLMT